MGTRSLTVVQSRWTEGEAYETNAVVYRHWDGYPAGHGQDLAKYLEGVIVVNGKRMNSPESELNGPGRLAAYLVKRLYDDKNEPDLRGSRVDCGQEFEYVISVMEDLRIIIEVFDGPATAFGMGGEKCDNRIFVGNVEDFTTFVNES
jgi:hypothetical protein